jgi:TetR/AcrR family transcriptional repressor of nem operon
MNPPKTDKRAHLLDAGAEVMLAKGYNGTGIQEIVDRAGVPKGSFYNYFKSKEAFALAALEHLSDASRAGYEAILQDPGLSPRQRLIALFDRFIEGHIARHDYTKGCLVGKLCQEMAAVNPTIGDKVEFLFRHYTSAIARCLRDAQAVGEVASDRDADQLAEFIFNGWEGALMRMKASRSPQPLNAFREILASTLLS